MEYIVVFLSYSMYTYLDTDCIDRFYLSEDFDANLGSLLIISFGYLIFVFTNCNVTVK